ncbi:carbohydrate ABC transporter permease [Microbacterium sp.]|uniref:carbohydrate ABC transporter permease n=1 Tax=Microbacterium sp. TaxID=51671 RepID=UPI003F9EA634
MTTRGIDRRRRRRRLSPPLILLLPFVVLFICFYVLPIIWSARDSLFSRRLIGGEVFIGLDNYAEAFTDPDFLSGFSNVLLLSAIQVPISIALALAIALVFDSGRLKGSPVYRLGVFLPFAVPSVVGGLLWGFLFSPQIGPLGQIARAAGTEPLNLLSSDWMLFTVGNILTWGGTGVAMIIIYTALTSVPQELDEAATLDGAGQIRIMYSIKIPLVMPVVLLMLLIAAVGTLQLLNEPAILRTLVPHVIGNAYSPNLYAYNVAFAANRPDYAAALSFILAGLVMALSYIALAATRGKKEKQ